MTSRVEVASPEATLGNHERRVRALEAAHQAAAAWPTAHVFDLWTDIEGATDVSAWRRSIDTACYRNGFIYNTAGADGEYIVWPVRLGPYGSIWQVGIVGNTRVDGGIVKFAFASAHDDFYYPGGYESHIDATFVDLATGLSFYSATPEKSFTTTTDLFRINGSDDDTTLTSIGGSDAEVPAAKIFDGGSGLYLFRVKVDGKQVASAGFFAEISHLTLKRVTV